MMPQAPVCVGESNRKSSKKYAANPFPAFKVTSISAVKFKCEGVVSANDRLHVPSFPALDESVQLSP